LENALEVRGLRKKIGKRLIIDNLSFSCRTGEIYGFIGPNGAGKTSTFRMILGLWSMDSGSIRICGMDINRQYREAMACTGGFVEAPVFYDYLSGFDNLLIAGRAHGGVSGTQIRRTAERLGLEKRLPDKVRRYSLGMRQRLGLARALLHEPRLLLLDEPTNGLDPAGARDVRNLLKELAHEKGTCVVISSHLMSEMERICDRVGILNQGRLAEEKAISLLAGFPLPDRGRTGYHFTVSPMERAREVLSRFPGGRVLAISDKGMDLLLTGEELSALNRLLVENGVSLQTVAPMEPRRLEDAFLEITGGGGQLG